MNVFRRRQLASRGFTKSRIQKLMDAGALRRLSQGWYATPSADETLVLAATTHSRIGCLSAAQFHGLWVPKPRIGFDGKPHPGGVMSSYIPTSYGPATDLHVLANKNESASRIRQRISKATGGRSRVCVHRSDGDKHQLVASVEEAIEQVARCHDGETALVVIESALNQRKVTPEWVEALLDRLPLGKSLAIGSVSELSESGTETRVAAFFRRKGVRVRQQVALTPDLRVDAVVGDSLIVESDSFAHHGSRQAFVKDRWRAGELEKMGYNVVSLSYEQVWDYWDETKKLLNSLISHRKHLRGIRSWAG